MLNLEKRKQSKWDSN